MSTLKVALIAILAIVALKVMVRVVPGLSFLAGYL